MRHFDTAKFYMVSDLDALVIRVDHRLIAVPYFKASTLPLVLFTPEPRMNFPFDRANYIHEKWEFEALECELSEIFD